MEKIKSTGVGFFLGASTPGGFTSLFDELLGPEDGWRLYILKGGPGTGKSTLLRRVAAEADRRGLFCERIFCSSDPDSLDAVLLPSLKVSVADGTAPHVLEPVYPGARDVTVELGVCRNDRLLYEKRAEVLRLTDENRALHEGARRYIAAAAAADAELRLLARRALREDALLAYARRLEERILPRTNGEARRRRRFLTAVTPKGVFTLRDTPPALCERRLSVSDPWGAAAETLLKSFASASEQGGGRDLFCPSFLDPETPQALFLPEADFGVLHTEVRSDAQGTRTLRAERFYDREALSEAGARLRFVRKAKRDLLGQAVALVRRAKAVHDDLEALYAEAMDFDAVRRIGDELIGEIFA